MLSVLAAAAYSVVVIPEAPVSPRIATVMKQLNASYVDEPAPAFELAAPGSPVGRRLDEYRGRWVFLNFWASWCEPCREEMPSMRRLAERMSGRGFTMMGVSLDTDLMAMQRFLNEIGVDGSQMVLLHDADGRVSRRYGTELLPETWLIDPDGQLVARFQGSYDWTSEEVLELMDLLTREGWRG